MVNISMTEAKAHFSEIARAAERGQSFLVSSGKNSRSVCAIVPLAVVQDRPQARLGFAAQLGAPTFSEDWHISDAELLGETE
jgi:antitoxin (DNA-binding transcriptional repressor) of toxin-antitoxin stability system